MRANSSVSSLIVVMSTLVGCRPGDDPVVAPAAPEPAKAPSPGPSQVAIDDLLRPVENERAAAQAQEEINAVREDPRAPDAQTGGGVATSPAVPARVLDRLVYQCTDDVTFAVRIVGGKLWVFAPGYSNGYIILEPVASDDGVHYAQRDADFRAKDDLATLRVDDRRYVDCVSNPAAAVWQQLTP